MAAAAAGGEVEAEAEAEAEAILLPLPEAGEAEGPRLEDDEEGDLVPAVGALRTDIYTIDYIN